MSYKFGSSLVPGAYHYGGGGLGVLGSTVPSTGEHGASFLYNDVVSNGLAANEVRGLVETPPSAGTWFAWEDGSFSLIGAPDGAYTATYRLFVDGVDSGTTTITITIGGAEVDGGTLAGSATLGDMTASGGVVSFPDGELVDTATLVARDGRRAYSATGRAELYNTPLGPKDPDEVVTLKFPFVRRLNGGAIAAILYATPTVCKGVDPSPGDVAVGLPDVSGTSVLQRMRGGLEGVGYKWRVKVVDSNGNEHILADWVLVKTL